MHLLDPHNKCAYLRVNKFVRFFDIKIKDETFWFAKMQIHIRTMDVEIVQHLRLQEAIKMELNLILLKPTNITIILLLH